MGSRVLGSQSVQEGEQQGRRGFPSAIGNQIHIRNISQEIWVGNWPQGRTGERTQAGMILPNVSKAAGRSALLLRLSGRFEVAGAAHR